MKIIDRYILRQFIPIFILIVISFFSLFTIIDLFSHLDEVTRNNVQLTVLLDFYMLVFPYVFVQIAPLSLLLAALYVIGTLNKNNELIAVISCGTSAVRVVLPVLFIALITSLTLFLIANSFALKHFSKAMDIQEFQIKSSDEEENTDEDTKPIENITYYGADNKLFYIGRFDSKYMLLSDVTILEHDTNNNVVSKIFAANASYASKKWTFYHGMIMKFDKGGKLQTQPEVFEEYTSKIKETPKDLLSGVSQVELMNFRELKDYTKKLSMGNSSTIRRLFVEMHHKAAFPISCLAILLASVPLAIKTHRSSSIAGFGKSILVGLSYYGFDALSVTLGKGGLVSPIPAAWAANVFYIIAGMYMLRKVTYPR